MKKCLLFIVVLLSACNQERGQELKSCHSECRDNFNTCKEKVHPHKDLSTEDSLKGFRDCLETRRKCFRSCVLKGKPYVPNDKGFTESSFTIDYDNRLWSE